jgi:hypothetical protein
MLLNLLFVVMHGSTVVGTLSGHVRVCRLIIWNVIQSTGFALLPEDALWRCCPIAFFNFCHSFFAYKVAAFNLSSSD